MPPTSPKKDMSKNEEGTLFEMFDYLCTRVDWGSSNLDSAGIRCMNTLFIKLGEQKEIHDLA